MAVLIGLLEVGGGILLIFGLFTRIIGLCLRLRWWLQSRPSIGNRCPGGTWDGYELALACGVIAFALASFGAGVVSV